MTTDLLEGLNARQREAVEAVDGPVLVVAGPGSGKTRVITHRIAYLVRVCGVSPYRIAAVTFTNKAAREMRERLFPLLGHDVDELSCGTFHSFCARILRRDGESIGLDRNFTIFDDDDQVSMIKRIMKEQGVDPKTFNPRAIQSSISRSKSQLLTAQGFRYNTDSYFDEIVLRVYERYEELLSQSSAVDFDDILLKTFLLLNDVPEVAQKYQSRFVHLMIDEFQDTNIAQYNIAKQLGELNRNVCAVGDPDQSIYSWRNADIRNLLSFQTDYAEARIITLDENYRSSQTILNAATGLIASNQSRVEKDLWTQNGEGVPIVVYEGYNEAEEAQFVVKEIQSLVRQGDYAHGDIAVMYRVNAQSRALEEACLRYGTSYQVVGGLRFYHREEIKDLTSFLRLVGNPDDDASLTRVINVPTRGIGQRTLDEVTRVARNNGTSMMKAIDAIATEGAGDIAARSVEALRRFKQLIQGLIDESEKLDLTALIDTVVERTGYGRHLAEEADRGEERLENVQAFRDSARDYVYLGLRGGLTAFLESVSLVSDVDSYENKADVITLITLHQAKGLEFRVVFIVGLEEGILPHLRSLDDEAEMEEERRLCYVGVTRARDRLYLVRAFRRGYQGGSEPRAPSRFLADIPQELIVPAESTRPKVRRQFTMSPFKRGRPEVETATAPRRRLVRSGGLAVETDNSGDGVKDRSSPEIQVSTGDKVRHAKFGVGIVMNTKPSGDDVEVTVVFDDGGGVKRLLQGFARLEKIE